MALLPSRAAQIQTAIPHEAGAAKLNRRWSALDSGRLEAEFECLESIHYAPCKLSRQPNRKPARGIDQKPLIALVRITR